RDLVQVQLEGEARLRSAVAALGTAWRLVREHAAALEAIRRYVIRDRLQRAGVKRGCDAVRAVRAAVERGAKVHGGDAAVFRHAGAHPHETGVASPVCVEDLLARERALDGAAGEH